MTRPTHGTCRCGAGFRVLIKGPIPVTCPACTALQTAGREGMRLLGLAFASPFYRSTNPGGDAAMLRAMADRLDPREPSDVIDDVLDGLAEEVIAPEKAAGLARRLNRARMALARAAGGDEVRAR